MDGRGPWDLEGSIREHQQVMTWYGERDIPVELNEPHHWGMRDAPDVIFVVSAFLSAYNARKFGVQDYIAQMMFNSPPGTRDAMDLAKMLAVLEMIIPLSVSNQVTASHSGSGNKPASACYRIQWIRMQHAGTLAPARTCRWRFDRTFIISSDTRRLIMQPLQTM